MLPMEDLLLYVNIGFIAFILIFALIGFMRGTYKSVYYLIVTVIVFGGGWLFRDAITKWLANFNLQFLNLNIQGVNLVTINQFVPEVLSNSIAGTSTLMETDTMFKALVFGLVQMVLKFVFFIALTILAFTVFKLIADILWLFIRPKKKKGKKVKKTIGSRFGGMGIGAAKGVFYMLLILFPLAGIASIASSISDITTEVDMKYNLVFVGDEVIVSPVAETSELDQILEMLDLYNDSLAGKVYSVGKVDTLLFDELFSFKVGESKIKLRKEIETVAKALNKAQVSIGSDAGFDQVLGELMEKDPDTLKEIIDEITKLELINVVIPVALEFVLLVEDENGNTMLDSLPEGLDISIDDVYEIDFASDIKNIGYGFVEISSIINLNETEQINFLALDPTVVKNAIDYIADTDIVRTYAPIGVSYLVNSETIGQTFTDLGISIADLGLEDIDEWDEEIKKFGTIYEAVVNLNIKMLENGDVDFSEVSETAIVNLSNALFESSIISNAIPVVANTVTSSMLPEEMKDVLVFDGIEWNKNEFSALLNATITIMHANLFGLSFDESFALEEDIIDRLARHLSSSQLLMKNMDNLMDYILGPLDLGEGISLGRFESWDDQELAEEELRAVLGSINILATQGFSDVNSFLSLTDGELNTLLQSDIISNTLVNVLKGYSGPGKQLEFLIGVDNEDVNWLDSSEQEVEFTISGNIITIKSIENATKYHIYSDGSFIGATRTDTFDVTGIEDIDLEAITVTGFTEGELRKIFIAIGSLADDLLGEGGFSTETITNLSDSEIDNILVSDILVLSIIDQLEERSAEDAFIVIPDGDLTAIDEQVKLTAWKNTSVDGVIVEGEMSKLLKGMRVFFAGNDINNFSTDMITSLEDQDIYEMLKSEVITESIIMQIDGFSSDDSLPIVIPNKLSINDINSREHWENKYVLDENNNHVYDNDGIIQVEKDGEITKLLRSLKYIFNGESVSDFDISVLYGENQNEILKSEVISETIVHMIVDESETDGSMLHLPRLPYLEDINSGNRSLWYNTYNENGDLVSKGEIGYLLDAAEIITEGGSFTGINFNISKAYDPIKQVTLLKSKIISETIVHAIKDEIEKEGSKLHLPSTLYLEDIYDENETNDGDNRYRDKWYNEYVNGELTRKGEIAHLLDAANIITSGGDFANIDFDISIAYGANNQKILLRSKIVSETIVQAIKDEIEKDNAILKLAPYPYVNDFEHPDRNLWYNSYDADGEIIIRGEIAHLLDAAKIITNDGDFKDITFDINVAYDQDNQATLLKSHIVAESMVHIINDELTNGDTLVRPSVTYINDIIDSNRELWYNKYIDARIIKGEIAHFIDAAYKILGPELALSDIEFSINDLFEEENQEVILKSAILSETIVSKIKNNDTAISDIPDEDLRGYPFDDAEDRRAWFNIYDEDGTLVEENEIVRFLKAIELILNGSEFEDLGVIDVDYILELDFAIIINDDKEVTSSKVAIMLDSMIIEKIIANHTGKITGTDKPLADYINEPVDGYHWLKADVYDSISGTYDSDLYDLESFLNSLFLMNALDIKYDKFNEINLLDLDANDITGLSEAMVISRVFKGSIAKMFNKLLVPVSNNYDNIIAFPDIVDMDDGKTGTKRSLEDVEFKQSYYTGTNLEAYDKLTETLATFNTSYPGKHGIGSPLFGQDYVAIEAFYDIE